MHLKTATSFLFAVMATLIATALIGAPAVKAFATELVVGSTSPGSAVGEFDLPYNVAVVGDAGLVSDTNNNRIINVSLEDGTISEFMSGLLPSPHSIVVCDDGVGYYGASNQLQTFDPSAQTPTASMWTSAVGQVLGLSCTDELLFVSEHSNAIRAFNRSTSDVVFEMTLADLTVTSVFDNALSPDHQHLAFASRPSKVGTINLATKVVTWYGSGTDGTVDGTADNAQFNDPWGLDWTPDGGTIVINQKNGFAGLRFIDFASGNVTSSANSDLMPTSFGRGVTVLSSTGEVVMTFAHGLKFTQVDGAASPILEMQQNFGGLTGEQQDRFLGQIGAMRRPAASAQAMNQWCQARDFI